MDLQLAFIVSVIFFCAGLVKGVVGFGLPTISLGLICLISDLKSAVVLLLFPSFATNIWQSLSGGEAFTLLKRFWHLYIFTLPTIWFGVIFFEDLDQQLGETLLGLLLLMYASYGLLGFKFTITRGMEKIVGGIAGGLNGCFTGLTGSFVFPGIMYLQSTGLKPGSLIQAMGILFTVSTIALGVALYHNDRITLDLTVTSILALLPTTLGFLLGSTLRNQMSEKQFRNVLYAAILLLGFALLGGTGDGGK